MKNTKDGYTQKQMKLRIRAHTVSDKEKQEQSNGTTDNHSNRELGL
jgi:hypothetical protein